MQSHDTSADKPAKRQKAFKSSDGQTVSIWQKTCRPIEFPALKKKVDVDVCVVGAGIAGLTTAYLLLKEGKSVVVLDDSAVGDGQTGRTSAHLASAVDDRFVEIAKMHGKEAARISYESHSAGISLIERIAHEEKIDCEFARLDGYLFCAPEHKPSYLDEEFQAAKQAGVDVQEVDRVPIKFDTGPALRFPNQGRFHPQKYLKGLCDAITGMGGTIHSKTRVTDVQGGDPEKNERCEATTARKIKVTASAIVVCTNTPAPINDWAGIYTKQASYRTYVIGCEIPKDAVPDALYWDTADDYHYVRLEDAGDKQVLLVGGGDHKTGQHGGHEDPFGELERWTREHFPQAGKVTFRWSGQVQEPEDGVAFIGVAPTKKPNVYVITGDSGMGLTHASLGAMIIRDQIMGRENPWAKLYEPTRKATGAPLEFIKENLNAASTYVEYVTPGEVKTADEIQPGCGALLRDGLKKHAVYRDPKGAVHEMTSVCPHLGCTVHWNDIEKTWDCPCHGSRFAATGNVILGPAISGLESIPEEESKK